MSVSFYLESDLNLYGDGSKPAGKDDRPTNPLNIVCIVNGPIMGNAYIVWEAKHPDQGMMRMAFCFPSDCY